MIVFKFYNFDCDKKYYKFNIAASQRGEPGEIKDMVDMFRDWLMAMGYPEKLVLETLNLEE